MRHAWIALIAAWVLFGAPASAEYTPPPPQPFDGRWIGTEAVSTPAESAQLARLMGDALEGLAPQRPGVLDVYVVSASLWGDPVFESEATQAAEILQRHFRSEGRTIVLSAGGAGERRYPAATPNNIAASIGQVGATMDPNEDLFVLFLTSHGTRDGAISLREERRLVSSMRPVNLRDILAASGIRNRVVIVSSCFSGAFIAPLMDANTIVLTAAAPDRSSFGCEPQRDWTFFGDAYFNNSLRGGGSVLTAFDQAKVLIERWEREQNMTPPSNPQRYVGTEAAALLRRAEQR